MEDVILIQFYHVQVMMRLFSPRKTTLLFVIRDKTRVQAFIPIFFNLFLEVKTHPIYNLMGYEFLFP